MFLCLRAGVGHHGGGGTTAAAMVHRVFAVYKHGWCLLSYKCTDSYCWQSRYEWIHLMYEFLCMNSYVWIHTKILWTSQTLPEGIFWKEYHHLEAIASGRCVVLRKRFWANQTALINSSQFKIITNRKWILQSSPVWSWLQQCQQCKVKWRCVSERSDEDNLDGVGVPSNIILNCHAENLVNWESMAKYSGSE